MPRSSVSVRTDAGFLRSRYLCGLERLHRVWRRPAVSRSLASSAQSAIMSAPNVGETGRGERGCHPRTAWRPLSGEAGTGSDE